MKILGISGSPRKNGNTEGMINHIAKNNLLETIRLYDKNIKPCLACDSCHKNTGECIIKDDMVEIITKIEESDILILGSPIYWWNITAPFKAFMDRWYSKKNSDVISNKKIIIVLPMADTDDNTAKWAIGSLKNSLEYNKAIIIDIIVGKGLTGKEDLSNNKELLEKLKTIL